MDFPDLYHFAQTLITERAAEGKTSVVPVIKLKSALIANVSWLLDINLHPIERKPGDPLGHYECFSDTDSRWEEPNAWLALITYDNTLNMCWRRFVWCKEMMHIFDTENGSVKSRDEYTTLLNELELKPLDPGEPYFSENNAQWMALLILCPKIQRDQMKDQRATQGLSEYDVALHFRIPESVVSSLFSDYYEEAYNRFVLGN